MSRPRRVGLPWYDLGTYAALRASLVDGAKLPAHYDTWRIATEQMEREVQRSGLPSDGATRARYAAEILAADAAA